ncbi:DUF1648 domain-containing protein [Flavobacterium hauense]
MENRPEIQLKMQPADIVLEVLGWTALIALWAYIIISYQSLPDVVATHFGSGGEPDGYGSKESTFLSAIIPTVLFIFMTFMQGRPHWFNYTETITGENAERQYRAGVRLMRTLKMSICLVFLIIEYLSVRVSTAETGEFDFVWMFLGIMLLIKLPLFYFLIKSSKSK